MSARRRIVLLLLGLGLGLGGCGGDGEGQAGPAERVAGDPGVAHIHGVGVNPADDAVIIATHTGLFRADPGKERAERIGDRRQDTMGFTVVGPDRFLGSGHPDLRDDLPPLLGLIRSQDAGRSWQPVSLLGEADFHVLRAAGRRIYGVNAADGRLLVSGDGGGRWARRTPPAAVLDLAVHPRDADRIVVSTDRGLFASPNGGRSWRPLDARPAGLLAWTEALVLVDGAGEVHASTDGGRSFTRVGAVGGRPAALSSHEGQLLAALEDNTVRVSADGGATWAVRVRGDA